MYGKNIYGKSLYGNPLNISPDYDDDSGGDEYTDLERYMPGYVTDIDEMHAIYQSEGYEAGAMHQGVTTSENQCYIDSTTWGIIRWENVYGIVLNDALQMSDRRSIVKQLIGAGATTTAQAIEDLAYQVTGTNASVKEETAKYSFTVFFYGTFGIPKNVLQFSKLLEKIIPAHLKYSLEYRYMTWAEMLEKTWSEANAYTWEGLRMNRIIPFTSWNDIDGKTWKSIRSYSWKTINNEEA